jgi:L-fucose isomerase
MDEKTPESPHVFAKITFDHEIHLEKLDANHCHAVYGDYREELIMICQMLGIEAEVLGDS